MRLLGAHVQMAMGMDRFKYLLRDVRRQRDPALFTPALFEPERFLDFRATDTNSLPPKFDRHYARIHARLDAGTITHAGDKLVPTDLFTLLAVAEQFPGARYVFVYRDVTRVANSFEVRARNPDDLAWPGEHGQRMACRQWAESFDLADSLIAAAGVDRVFPVHSNVLYHPDGRLRDALFDFLGLDVSEGVRETFERLSREWSQRQAVPEILDSATQRAVEERTDRRQVARYQRWVELAAASNGGGERVRRQLAQHRAQVQVEANQRALEVDERAIQARRRKRALAQAEGPPIKPVTPATRDQSLARQEFPGWAAAQPQSTT